MGGKMSRDKGKRGEREAAHEVTEVLGVEARRGRQFHGRDDSPDIIVALEGLHVEVKRAETLDLYAALLQGQGDAKGKLPLVMHRKNGKPWVAICYFADLPELANLIERSSNGKAKRLRPGLAGGPGGPLVGSQPLCVPQPPAGLVPGGVVFMDDIVTVEKF